MATLIPVSGSFTEYAERFVDESLAFAVGWAYWYLWVTVGSILLDPEIESKLIVGRYWRMNTIRYHS
jgi:amino acid transporter